MKYINLKILLHGKRVDTSVLFEVVNYFQQHSKEMLVIFKRSEWKWGHLWHQLIAEGSGLFTCHQGSAWCLEFFSRGEKLFVYSSWIPQSCQDEQGQLKRTGPFGVLLFIDWLIFLSVVWITIEFWKVQDENDNFLRRLS